MALVWLTCEFDLLTLVLLGKLKFNMYRHLPYLKVVFLSEARKDQTRANKDTK